MADKVSPEIRLIYYLSLNKMNTTNDVDALVKLSNIWNIYELLRENTAIEIARKIADGLIELSQEDEDAKFRRRIKECWKQHVYHNDFNIFGV